MIQRCTDKARPDYARYGGSGIAVCDRWRVFVNFLADMGEKPQGFTIERTDNSKGYEPGNCRWATPQEQQYNRTTTRYLTYKGETRCMAEWAVLLGVPYLLLKDRIRKGWNTERAIETPHRSALHAKR